MSDALGDRMKMYEMVEAGRSEYREIDMPPLTRVKNRVDVLFNGADPVVAEEEVPQESPC